MLHERLLPPWQAQASRPVCETCCFALQNLLFQRVKLIVSERETYCFAPLLYMRGKQQTFIFGLSLYWTAMPVGVS